MHVVAWYRGTTDQSSPLRPAMHQITNAPHYVKFYRARSNDVPENRYNFTPFSVLAPWVTPGPKFFNLGTDEQQDQDYQSATFIYLFIYFRPQWVHTQTED